MHSKSTTAKISFSDENVICPAQNSECWQQIRIVPKELGQISYISHHASIYFNFWFSPQTIIVK